MRLLVPAVASLALLAAVPFAQKRVQPDEPEDFPAVLAAAGEAWKEQRYGGCLAELKKALSLATRKRTQAIAVALPAAPEGWKRTVDDPNEDASQNPFAAGLMASVGSMVTVRYRQESGGGSFEAQVTADSPMVQMLNLWIANPAMLEKGSELIDYEGHKAVLKSRDDTPQQLMILLLGQHVCEVNVRNASEEQLFALFDQAAVNKLAQALAR